MILRQLPLMVAFVLSLSTSVLAQTAPAAPASSAASPAPPAPPPIQLRLPWTGRTGHGVGFGVDEGGWSGGFLTGLRIKVPLASDYLALVLRPNFVSAGVGPNHVGGRLDFIGESPVFLNLVRLYGGGGVEVYAPVGDGTTSHTPAWSGGGQIGFEFFLSRYSSFFLEVGGHGGFGVSSVNGVEGPLGAGLTVIAGLTLYPFT